MNKSALALMLSIDHRTPHLFDIMAKLSPSSSNDIAVKANLNERYVREWLGALVTSKIVYYDAKSNFYSISKDKFNLLTSDDSFNFTTSIQFIPVMAQVENQILNCFKMVVAW